MTLEPMLRLIAGLFVAASVLLGMLYTRTSCGSPCSSG